jgi:hypothetical protein
MMLTMSLADAPPHATTEKTNTITSKQHSLFLRIIGSFSSKCGK